MRSAAGLWRVSVALGALAAVVTGLGGVAAVRALQLEAGSLGALMDVCRRYVIPDPGAASFAVVALGSLSIAVLVLAVREASRQWRGLRRFRRREQLVAVTTIAGHEVRVVDDQVPRAYCAGWLCPTISISNGALAVLDHDEILAVLAHEAHHARRRDPLRLLVVKVLGEALFFVPVLRHLRKRYAALAELAADEAAVTACGGPQALASALLRFGATSSPGVVVGIAPERVDHLLGERPRWGLQVSLVAGGLVTLGGLALLVAGTAASVPSGAVSTSLLAAQACMGAMTIVPIVAGGFLLLAATRRLRRVH